MAINPVEIIIRAKDEASGIFSSMGSKVAAVGASIAAYFGVNAFIGAVKGAADLEAKLSEVAAVSGATAAEMVQLRQAAEAAGASTKFTATEAADALGNLSRAGLSAKDAITALPAVLQLAQAGGVELGAASEYVTKTIMGLGLAFTDAGRVADVLALGANASNTSVNGLAQALSYAAPLANTLGLSLETTVAIIGKFADAGIDASRAGTALNAIMAQFADPASKFRAELSNAGITTTNFEQALRQLAAAGPAGSKAINAVGTEAGPALRALLNQGIGALDDLKGKLDNAAGSAAKTAAVMEGNLNGAMKGMSSAWDTVKNALTTPVLPVLTQGMNDLAAAFRGMVNGGTVARFGAAITTAFEGAIKWVKAFAAEADFGALATRMQAFATDTQATFTKLGEYATNAGNMVKTAYGVMSAGVDAVLVVVYGLGEAFSGVASNIQSGLALLLQGLAKITFGGVSESFKQAAAEVKLSAEATWAASEAFAAKGQKAFEGMAAGAETARDGWVGLASDTAAASAQASTSAPVFKAMADNLTGVGNAALDAGNKAKDSGDKQQAAALAAKDEVAALRLEYEAAVATGNWQLAVEKLQALSGAANTATASIADLEKQAAEKAAAIAASFERMGIKTKENLATIAITARQDFELVKESGQATAEGLQTAFKKYAEAAIAANGGVATEAIKSEAAMRGLQVQTDSTGKSIVNSMGSASTATQQFGGHVRATTEDIKRQADVLKILQAMADRSAAPRSNRDKIDEENPYGKTSDGLTANQDGAAKGTFNNTLPTDLAYRVKNAVDTGQTISMTQAELNTAKTQARNALNFLQEMSKLSAGAVSVQALQDAQALVNATNTGRVTVTDAKASTTTPAKTYTVNINMGGTRTAINTSSDADAQALIAALKRAQQTAA